MVEANSTRKATLQDQERLEKLWKVNAQRMNLDFDKYRKAAVMILSNIDYGVVFVHEEGEEVTGFMMFTYEWSDWRDGVFYWL
jgi:hypothetical protein